MSQRGTPHEQILQTEVGGRGTVQIGGTLTDVTGSAAFVWLGGWKKGKNASTCRRGNWVLVRGRAVSRGRAADHGSWSQTSPRQRWTSGIIRVPEPADRHSLLGNRL